MARYIDADKIQYCMVPTIRGTGMMTFKDMIDKIPTADVRPERHGNWVKESKMMGAFQRNLCICNICGCWYDEDGCEEAFKYCPKCGAKMDGKDV